MDHDGFKHELKQFIVESLMLKDVRANDIESEAPLFVEGLGLDSIDALEFGMVLSREYSVNIKANDEHNKDICRSVGGLAAFIDGHRRKEGFPS